MQVTFNVYFGTLLANENSIIQHISQNMLQAPLGLSIESCNVYL